MRTLLSLGAEVNAIDRWEETALDGATRGGHTAVVDLLKHKGAKLGNEKGAEAKLLKAVDEGDRDMVQTLINAGVSPNASDYDQRYAVHLAVASNNLEMVKLLVENGASLLVVDRFGGTPLTEAARGAARVGSQDMREYLLSHGAAGGFGCCFC